MGWALEEMAINHFEDERLHKRAALVLESLAADPQASIPKACEDWRATKAAYRFFENKKVTVEKVIAAHIEKSISRISQEKRVFMIQDTTEINYTSQQCKQDAGPANHEAEKIVFLHPTIAVTPNKVCLGVTNLHYWHRDVISREHTEKKKSLRKKLPIEDKESYRWLLGYKHASKIAQQCPNTHVIMLADREGDISDIYAEAEETTGVKADWIVRGKKTSRRLLQKTGKKAKQGLYEKLLKQNPAGRISFVLPHRSTKTSRTVTQEVRTLRAQVSPPKRNVANRLQPYWVTAVLATEVAPPKGEKPIEWLIFTSIELNEEIKCQDILSWYLCRWQIEVFFYTLKLGCKVEQLQLTTGDRFMPCIAIYCIVAWRILLLTHYARSAPETNVEALFDTIEWHYAYAKVHKKRPPKQAITLGEMVILIARMGGFLARKCDGNPGPKTIWQGLHKLNNLIEAHELQSLVKTCG